MLSTAFERIKKSHHHKNLTAENAEAIARKAAKRVSFG
jgi:hypothetical protein